MRFGFLVFDGLEELDLLGPWELIGVWGLQFGGPEERVLVGEQPGEVTCAKGLRLAAEYGFDDARGFDALLVPGGAGSRVAARNHAVCRFVDGQFARGPVLSVCTGALVLAAAGLLKGRTATTHFSALDQLRTTDGVRVAEQRYTQADGLWTSAGISAGMDMTLAFIAAHADADTAGRVQRWAEYYPDTRRYGDPAIHADMPAYVHAS